MAALKRIVMQMLPLATLGAEAKHETAQKAERRREADRERKRRSRNVTRIPADTAESCGIPSLPPSPSFPPDPHNNPLPPTHPASPLAGNFADPDHASAYERLRLASGRGFAVDAGLRGVAHGMGSGPAYDWPTIGQALVEMDAAGAKFSAEAVRGFCRRLLRPNPALGGNGAPTRQDRNLAVLNDWLAKEQASGNP